MTSTREMMKTIHRKTRRRETPIGALKTQSLAETRIFDEARGKRSFAEKQSAKQTWDVRAPPHTPPPPTHPPIPPWGVLDLWMAAFLLAPPLQVKWNRYEYLFIAPSIHRRWVTSSFYFPMVRFGIGRARVATNGRRNWPSGDISAIYTRTTYGQEWCEFSG